MNIEKGKVFNLEERRPKVLLMGNGLTYGSTVPWHELIYKVARPGIDFSKYEERDEKDQFIRFHVPNTVLTLATSEVSDDRRHTRYVDVLKDIQYPENQKLKELLSIPFDAILTTNYTYELEAALYPRYPSLKEAGKRNYAYVTEKNRDGRILLQTYNRLPGSGQEIWHIHGELRRPSSIILSHDEYARLVRELLTYNRERGGTYETKRTELEFKSWVDYFLMGDVYILGLSFDFSEFDLWWLLGRRLREKSGCGKIVFYEPKKNDSIHKQYALQDAGVDVRTMDVEIGSNGGTYEVFYKQALNDIRKEVSGK